MKQTETKKKNAFYNQLTQIAKINDYVNKNITYFKMRKIINYDKKHSERDINTNNEIQIKNWKMYADSFFEQNIIKNTSDIILIVSFYAFFEFRIIIYVFSLSLTFNKKIQFQSIKKKKKIDFFVDQNIDVNSF